MAYRTPEQDEHLNNLYAQRLKMEDHIMALPGNRQFEDFPGWAEINAEIEEIVNPAKCQCYEYTDDNPSCPVHDPLAVAGDWAADPRTEEQKALDEWQADVDDLRSMLLGC